MSRHFVRTSSQYLQAATPPAITHPFTIALWAKFTDFPGGQCPLQLNNSGSTTLRYFFEITDLGTTGQFKWYARGSSAYIHADTTTTLNAATWYHLCGVEAAADSRAAFVNGGDKATNAETSVVSGINCMSIGRAGDSSPGNYLNGDVAEVGIWNVALTDPEVAVLGKGYSPLFVRPQNLIFYLPLIRDDDEDLILGQSLSAVNTPTVTAHSRIIRPSLASLGLHIAAAAGIVVLKRRRM